MKKKFIIALATVLLIFTSFSLSGCNFGSWFKLDLDAPTVSINAENKTLKWQSVTNVDKYEVYCNNDKVGTVVGVSGTNSYNFSGLITDDVAIYKFYLISTAEKYNSSVKSNIVTYLNSDETYEPSTNDESISNSNLNNIRNLEINNSILMWDAVDNVSKYYIFMFTNDLGERVFESTVNAFNFSTYVTDDEVVMFRVGFKNSENVLLMSLPKYYNTTTEMPEYNNKFYYFQGKVNDYYITSQQELNEIVYYAFIYKIENLDVCISSDYLNNLVSQTGTAQNWAHLTYAVQTACGSFTESCHYDTKLINVTRDDYYKRTFTIQFIYVGGSEPTNTTNILREQSEFDTPYYEKVDYEKRSESFNNFASDKNLLVEYVETGEQLYHVVESGATPIFKNSTCSAYVLYNKAKQVLREIISDEMTEFEKVLSIFDYICYNTVYDDEITVLPEDSDPSFISYTSFFLEGVFNDGLAVCDGFSKAFSLLCNMEGINAYRITGSVSGGLHAWNKVKVNGNWYVVDITWTVTETQEADFVDGGEAVNFNSKEFLSYKYFLVSDSYISRTHTASNSELNKQLPAFSDYYYYSNATYDGTHSFIISSDNDFENLVSYMLQTKQFGVEIVFASSYITAPVESSFGHDSALTAACRKVKAACGIPNSNILCVGYTYKQVDSNVSGTIYSITLINLPDALKSAA